MEGRSSSDTPGASMAGSAASAQRPYTFYYDGECGFCTRACRLLAACDLRRRVRWVAFQSLEALPGELTEADFRREAYIQHGEALEGGFYSVAAVDAGAAAVVAAGAAGVVAGGRPAGQGGVRVGGAEPMAAAGFGVLGRVVSGSSLGRARFFACGLRMTREAALRMTKEAPPLDDRSRAGGGTGRFRRVGGVSGPLGCRRASGRQKWAPLRTTGATGSLGQPLSLALSPAGASGLRQRRLRGWWADAGFRSDGGSQVLRLLRRSGRQTRASGRQECWCRRWGSNPHEELPSTVFETVASAIPPLRPENR